MVTHSKTLVLALALAAAGAVAPPSLRGVKEAASGVETAGDTFELSLAKEVERLNAALVEKDAVIAEKDAALAELSQHRSSGRSLDFGSSSTGGGDLPFVPTVCVITDELYNPTTGVSAINPFWQKWRAGADAAVAQVMYKNFGQPSSIDVDGYIEAITTCCDEADALVVAVPFSRDTPSYGRADAAINDCLAKNGEFPIFSTRYDTYKNPQLYGYVGGENYAYGQQCARALLFTEYPANATVEPQANLDAVSGRGPALPAPVTGALGRCPNATCQVVWSELTRSNVGQQRLVAGLNKTLLDYGFSLEVIAPSAEDQLEAYDATTGFLNKTFIYSDAYWPEYADISNGFQVLLSTRGYDWFESSSKLLCGQVLWKDPSWQIGEDPFRQGQTAVSSAAAAARLVASGGEWQATKGNNEANSGSSTINFAIPVTLPTGCDGPLHWIGDGYCDFGLNTPACSYDAGDCCEWSCIPNKYQCGVKMGWTRTYDCKDPEPYKYMGPGHCVDSSNQRPPHCWSWDQTQASCKEICSGVSGCRAYEFGQKHPHPQTGVWEPLCQLVYPGGFSTCPAGFTGNPVGDGGNAVVQTRPNRNLFDGGGACYKNRKVTFEANDDTIRHAVALWLSDRDEAIQKYGHISTWRTHRVTDMSFLFCAYPTLGGGRHASCNGFNEYFDDDISAWDTSNVLTMRFMFYGASSFDQPIGGWNVGSVTDMYAMFHDASSFNQPLVGWNACRVTDMRNMFSDAIAFNQNGHWQICAISLWGVRFDGAFHNTPCWLNYCGAELYRCC